jgi:RNA polymerase-binding protein DksA
MRASQLDHFKRLLLEKQRELLTVTSESGHSVPAAGASRGDSIEEADAAAEAELQIRLHQTDGPLLRAIEDALGRIRQGTYGVCGNCGVHISIIRLEAVPWTHRCRDCKEGRSA